MSFFYYIKLSMPPLPVVPSLWQPARAPTPSVLRATYCCRPQRTCKQVCGRVGHRHFFSRESFKQLRLSFFVVGALVKTENGAPSLCEQQSLLAANEEKEWFTCKLWGLSKKFSNNCRFLIVFLLYIFRFVLQLFFQSC